jgi:hypothetical protein
LLKDARVDPNIPDAESRTTLWWIAAMGYTNIIKVVLASDKFIDLETRGVESWEDLREVLTPLEIARKNEMTETVAALERFVMDPERTRHELRMELGMAQSESAEVFALVVFLCDEHLTLQS